MCLVFIIITLNEVQSRILAEVTQIRSFFPPQINIRWLIMLFLAVIAKGLKKNILLLKYIIKRVLCIKLII